LSSRTEAILADLIGQVTEAVMSDNYWNKWGRHYLPALARAYLNSTCTNFKDKALQTFTSPLFERLRDEGDKIFMEIPPPTPSRGGVRMTSAAYTRSYNNSSNPCFHGDSLVLMADGSMKRVGDVKKGDRVGKSRGIVRCVLKTLCQDGKSDLVELDGGLLITPYHPVKHNGAWTFPKDVKAPVEMECDAVYSFVLDSGSGKHYIEINGVTCVTLGHDFDDNDVIKHEYVGRASEP